MNIRTAVAAATLVIVLPRVAAAQDASSTRAWELRVPGGAFVATGDLRDQVKDGQVSALQLSRRVSPRLAITGTFAWAGSRDLATSGTPKLDVFSTDLGVEARSAEWFTERRVSLSAFAGLGAGMRSYNYRKLDVDATNNLAGYGAVGGEVGMGRFALRVEARDYVAGFRPLVGAGTSAVRNDVTVMAALRFNRRRAQERE